MGFRIILVAFEAAVGLLAQTDQCLIRGRVADATRSLLPRALIRIIAKESMTVMYRGYADDGTFCINNLSPGTYTVRAWVSGFQENSVRDVVVRSSETTDVGTVQLEIGGCDAPGVICDDFSTPLTFPSKPDPIHEATRADLHLPRTCGIDLDKGKVICPRSKGLAKDIDVIFLEEDGALLLRPTNGALIQPGCKGAYRDQALRVEGFGIGDDFCVKTRRGYESHLFFEGDDVEPATTKLTLWMVTKK